MRSYPAIVSLLISFVLVLTGATQEIEQGFLNLVNMVPNHKPCSITIAGKELVPGGLKEVSSTGWFIVPKGSHAMSLEIEGIKSAKGAVTLDANESVLYVIFLQQISSKKDENGKLPPPELRIKRCTPMDEKKGHQLEVISLCPETENFQIGPNQLTLELFGKQDIPNWNGGAFNVLHREKTIGSCAGSQEKGAYTLLIGSNHKRTLAALLVRNEKQELPPWMKPKK
jgi:hypothetical protein